MDQLAPVFCAGNVALRTAATVDELLADPIGSCFAGPSFLYFYPHAGFNGFSLWGTPNEQDIALLIQALDCTRRPGTQPYVSLIDNSKLEHVYELVFARMAAYQKERMPGYASLIVRQAMVRPAGMLGATVGGFYRVVEPVFPVEVFDTVAAALAWLGWPTGRELENELERFRAEAAGSAPILRQVREILIADPADADLPAVARALSLSPRTLQRRLREAGSSFQEELDAARVRAAQRSMLDPEAKLTAIAIEVGCSSLQHFSTLFRKLTGQTPSDWRARHR